jgi:hypothetical protein
VIDVLARLGDRKWDEPFSFTLKLQDGNRNAPLAADVTALDAILFAGGAAELVYSYAAWLAGDEGRLPYSPRAFAEFDDEFGKWVGWNLHWIDLYHERPDACRAVFERMLRRRKGGYWAIGSGDLLRLELVEAWRENPSLRKILVSGAAGIGFLFTASFSAIQVVKEVDAPTCRQQAYDWGERQTHELLRQGRFEGTLSEQSYQRLQGVVNARVAACGSHWRFMKWGLKPDGTLEMEADASTPRTQS